ncbi:MAG TPA: two-component regulator propeller domain-containing protein [Bacteroidales bacterium]|jgi:ligand-binding sensor domain-containing protein|nr:two-component regulator propeller domain-containing protein [Bacteroidales bacterium]HQM70147.1 two-component regulator propeller domain-containing protein [Bacteroidales bacterium]
MRKAVLFTLLSLFLTGSCQKDDLVNNFDSDISFEVSNHLLNGKHINCIDIYSERYVAIGSAKDLYLLDGSDQDIYTLDYDIYSLAIASDKSVWIGTSGGGLGHLSGKKFTWYTNANAGLPRDYVRHVEIAPDGDVWFTSCAFRIGGLGIFDGEKFEFLTPENSPLNQNIVEDLEIDADGTVYIVTTGTVGRTNIYRITNGSWECLGNEEGTFYWIFSFTVSHSGLIYLVEDFSLSSTMAANKVYRSKDKGWERITPEDFPRISYFSSIIADKRDYCWLAGTEQESAYLQVFTGKQWIKSSGNLFPDDFITTLEVDGNNNIWVGTYNNGVFILNQ